MKTSIPAAPAPSDDRSEDHAQLLAVRREMVTGSEIRRLGEARTVKQRAYDEADAVRLRCDRELRDADRAFRAARDALERRDAELERRLIETADPAIDQLLAEIRQLEDDLMHGAMMRPEHAREVLGRLRTARDEVRSLKLVPGDPAPIIARVRAEFSLGVKPEPVP